MTNKPFCLSLPLLSGAVISLASSGCTPEALGAGADNECPAWESAAVTPTDPPNMEPPKRTVDLAACTGGLAQADIDSHVALADKVEVDFREQPQCGVLARNYAYALSHWFAASACGRATRPEGFMYTGSGYYRAGGFMGVQAKLAKDTSFGKAGDDVPFDLFDHNSYGLGPMIIKATIIVNSTWSTEAVDEVDIHLKGSLEITQEQPKPEGLELWGIPADGKPITKQQEELAKTIGESVAFTIDADINEFTSGSGVKYRFTAPNTTIDATYQGAPIAFELLSIEAEDAELGQKAALIDYNVSYVPLSHGPLNGSFTLRIDGGKFPYYAKYSYANRVSPDVLITCNQPAP